MSERYTVNDRSLHVVWNKSPGTVMCLGKMGEIKDRISPKYQILHEHVSTRAQITGSLYSSHHS